MSSIDTKRIHFLKPLCWFAYIVLLPFLIYVMLTTLIGSAELAGSVFQYVLLPQYFPFICYGSITLSILLTLFMVLVDIRDVPVARSSHQQPTPLSGGVATFTLCSFVIYILSISPLSLAVFGKPFWLTMLATTTLMLILGLIDDWRSVPAIIRGLGQILAGTLIIAAGLKYSVVHLPYFGAVPLGPFSSPFTLLWIVFFTNAYNFMDGLNGLAAGMGLVACCFMIALTPFHHNLAVSFLAVGLIFGFIGFLLFNFPKAYIFMGDAGSQSIGLVLACMSVLSCQKDPLTFSPLSFPILFLPLIFDVAFTLIHRIWEGKNIFRAHREHLFQRLTEIGLSHAHVTILHVVAVAIYGIGLLYWHEAHLHVAYLLCIGLIAQSVYAVWVMRTHTKLQQNAHHTDDIYP